MLRLATLFALGVCALGCTVGEGRGNVESDRLYIKGCWNGPFRLNPDFFGVNPYRDTLMIRVQRGDNVEEQSDGLTVLVKDLEELRARPGESIQVGLPVGVSPPGVPLMLNPDPPKVSLSIYLHNSCHLLNSTIYSISGTIVFNSLFSGELSEAQAEDRLTDATFDAQFADPRQLAAGESAEKVVSQVRGNFSFYFQRGQPSQPFQ